jgi:hypothetical protein
MAYTRPDAAFNLVFKMRLHEAHLNVGLTHWKTGYPRAGHLLLDSQDANRSGNTVHTSTTTSTACSAGVGNHGR